MGTILRGIAASSGIAIAKAYRLVEPDLSIEKKTVSDTTSEIKRLQDALTISISDLEAIRDKTKLELGEDKAEIFDAHIFILNDPELINQVEDKIKSENLNAEYALKEVTDMFIEMFEQMDNEYMRERAADIRDVRKRVLSHLLGVKIVNPSLIEEDAILVAEDLTPSDTAQLNRQYV